MKTLISLLLVCIALTAFSQNSITGNVSSNEGPLVGANIIIKNSDKGAISNLEGDFKLNVTIKDTLVISYLGYKSEEIVVGQHENIKVLLEGNIALDEVEIIAYETNTKTYCSSVCCPYVTTISCVCETVKIEKYNESKSGEVLEKLYPNPSKTGRFQIKLIDDYKNVDVQVYNRSGQLVKTLSKQPVSKLVHLDLSQSPSGMYLVNIGANGKRLITKKAIID